MVTVIDMATGATLTCEAAEPGYRDAPPATTGSGYASVPQLGLQPLTTTPGARPGMPPDLAHLPVAVILRRLES